MISLRPTTLRAALSDPPPTGLLTCERHLADVGLARRRPRAEPDVPEHDLTSGDPEHAGAGEIGGMHDPAVERQLDGAALRPEFVVAGVIGDVGMRRPCR